LKVNLQDKLKWVSIETFFGALISQTVMIIIEMGSTGLGNLDPLMNYKEFAAALSTIAGNFSPYIFSLGLISAGLLSLVVISLGSAWGFLEAIGKNDKLNFIKIYSIESIPAFILICLLNNQDIIVSMLEVLSIFPIIVSIPSILIGILISDEKIMGKYKYDGFRLILYWIMVIIVLACGIVSLIK
jgi:Mn2+/Fe2+ NRAMP family transporter